MYKKIKFVDVSHWKPVSDWKKAKAAYPLLISKATQGTSYIDPTLKSFISNCEKNKIPYWLYSFVTKGKELKSAKYMVKTCKDLVGDYFCGYIIDAEVNPKDGTRPTATGVAEAIKYLHTIVPKTMLYIGYADYSRYKSVINTKPKNCALWEARYGKNDGKDDCGTYKVHNGVDVHQYSDNYSSNTDGVSNHTDINHTTGTLPPSFFAQSISAIKKAETGKTTYGTVTTKHTGLNLRKTASTQAAILKSIPKGAKIQILKKGTTWHKVRYNGTTGWSMSKYIKIE